MKAFTFTALCFALWCALMFTFLSKIGVEFNTAMHEYTESNKCIQALVDAGVSRARIVRNTTTCTVLGEQS
ncbi:hypothetical protein ACPV5S_15760 [Vibrio astriarenae]